MLGTNAHLSRDTFFAQYRPIAEGIVHGIPEIPMYETFGDDYSAVRQTPDSNVWTVIDVALLPEDEIPRDEDGDEYWLIVPGLHHVNRLGYIITEEPWENDAIVVWY